MDAWEVLGRAYETSVTGGTNTLYSPTHPPTHTYRNSSKPAFSSALNRLLFLFLPTHPPTHPPTGQAAFALCVAAAQQLGEAVTGADVWKAGGPEACQGMTAAEVLAKSRETSVKGGKNTWVGEWVGEWVVPSYATQMTAN